MKAKVHKIHTDIAIKDCVNLGNAVINTTDGQGFIYLRDIDISKVAIIVSDETTKKQYMIQVGEALKKTMDAAHEKVQSYAAEEADDDTPVDTETTGTEGN